MDEAIRHALDGALLDAVAEGSVGSRDRGSGREDLPLPGVARRVHVRDVVARGPDAPLRHQQGPARHVQHAEESGHPSLRQAVRRTS